MISVFHCTHCNESFKVLPENLANRESLVCPNCGAIFPEEVLKHLRDLGTAYREAIDVLYQGNKEGSGWFISVAALDTPRPEGGKYLKFFHSEAKGYWERPPLAR
ncbi:MAG: hypothetical protein WD024_04665 [Bacillota bacterium]